MTPPKKSKRPEWLWDTEFIQDEMARLARQAREYIEHLEAENTVHETELEIYDKLLEGAKAEIERLKAVERSRCDCGHPKADHDFSNPDFNTPCLPRSRCGCNNYVPLHPTPAEEPREGE